MFQKWLWLSQMARKVVVGLANELPEGCPVGKCSWLSQIARKVVLVLAYVPEVVPALANGLQSGRESRKWVCARGEAEQMPAYKPLGGALLVLA